MSLQSYLRRQQKRRQFEVALLKAARAFVVFFITSQFFLWMTWILYGFRAFSKLVVISGPLSLTISSCLFLWCLRRRTPAISLPEMAREIENKTPLFHQSPELKGELVAAASFLKDSPSDFAKEHRRLWDKRSRALSFEWGIRPAIFVWIFLAGALCALHPFLYQIVKPQLPIALNGWRVDRYEILLPYENENWEPKEGSLSGVEGSRIRFPNPSDSLTLETYLFVKEGSAPWSARRCLDYCEWTLRETGQYAVGSLFRRSSIFPLQVFADEKPQGTLFAKVHGELNPSVTLEIWNKDSLDLEWVASDDLRLKRVELRHRFQEEDLKISALDFRNKKERQWRQTETLSMKGWKAGSHEVYLRIFDDLRSVDSAPLTILYADENTERQKRIQEIRGLLDSWVHILADLIESKKDRQVSPHLSSRLQSIEYPQLEDNHKFNALIREMIALSNRIQNWQRTQAPMGTLPDLIRRTERLILYGLALLFEEKVGEVETSSQDLAKSQRDISDLLNDIKNGKSSWDSEALQKAFDQLAKQLEELREKMKNLPQGPQDDLLNREALESQMDESQTLMDRIEAIRRQAEAGDSEGAIRELESLLNQLSILSKEMERTMEQWKENRDRGSLEASQKYAEKLKDLERRQKEIVEKTEKLRKKQEHYDQQMASKSFEEQQRQQKQLEKERDQLQGEQQKLSDAFQSAQQEFDEKVTGAEWQEVFQSEERQELERQITENMGEAQQGLSDNRMPEALSHGRESGELLRQAAELQQKIQEQMTSSPSASGGGRGGRRENVEILGSERKGDRERRKKILDSLNQKVDKPFQKSHEKYFEEMLQR